MLIPHYYQISIVMIIERMSVGFLKGPQPNEPNEPSVILSLSIAAERSLSRVLESVGAHFSAERVGERVGRVGDQMMITETRAIWPSLSPSLSYPFWPHSLSLSLSGLLTQAN